MTSPPTPVALRTGGKTAPCVHRRRIGRAGVAVHVEQMLMPTPRPRDIAVMADLRTYEVRSRED
jgi:hypothetical protein